MQRNTKIFRGEGVSLDARRVAPWEGAHKEISDGSVPA